MDKMQFENGVLETPAKVVIDGVEYEVIPAVYSGDTPFSAENINQMQSNIENEFNTKQDKMITGTWTPTLNTVENIAPTAEYTYNTGRYFKMGKLVFIQFAIRGKIIALNGTSNYALVAGLPFRARSVNTGENAVNIGNLYEATDNINNCIGLCIEKAIRIQYNNGAGASKWKVTNYFDLAGSGWYETDE